MLKNSLSAISNLSDAETRSISPENITGEPGKGAMTPLEQGSAKEAARDLGDGWKVNPYLLMPPGEVTVLADVKGSGTIQHIWMTPGTTDWRNLILRFYWDGSDVPAVE